MIRTRHMGFGARSIGFSVALAVAVLVSTGRIADAACTDCTFDGTGAGASISGAADDSGFGFNALEGNPTGDNTGDYNTAAGAYALSENNTGIVNTAVGYAALDLNTSGSDNTATGSGALIDNTGGDDNTATGYEALYSNIGRPPEKKLSPSTLRAMRTSRSATWRDPTSPPATTTSTSAE